MDRPFFNRKIEELQREFIDRLDDLQFLEVLVYELTFRNTAASRRLQQETSRRITELKKARKPSAMGSTQGSLSERTHWDTHRFLAELADIRVRGCRELTSVHWDTHQFRAR